MFNLIIFLSLIPLLSPQCLDLSTISCQICSFSTFDTFYQTTLKLSISENLSPLNCLSKSPAIQVSRRILINNSICSNQTNNVSYDYCYDDLLEAFQTESRNTLIFSTYTIDFLLYEGDHYINKTSLEGFEIELFRRNFIDISIKPLNINDIVKIIIKTNEFFLFISGNLIIERICFVGVLDYNITKTPTNYYGFINLELIFDSTAKKPSIFINNCSFSSFLLNYLSFGWNSLFVIAPWGGDLTINNSYVKNCQFFRGFLYYSYNSYDVLFGMVIHDTSLSDNFQIMNIFINNSHFEDYNEFFIENSDFSLINLMNFNGNFTVNNTSFRKIFHIKNIILIKNSLSNTCFVNFFNITMIELYNTSTIYISSVSSLLIDYIYINISDSSILYIYSTPCEISYLSVKSIDLIEDDAFILINSYISIKNSYFSNITIKDLFSMINSNTLINNSTFFNITMKNSLFSSIQAVSFNVSLAVILNIFQFNINDNIGLFYISDVSYFSTISCLLRNLTIYNIFLLNNVLINENKEIYINSNNIFNIWSTDHTCTKTIIFLSLIQNNTILSKILGIMTLQEAQFYATLTHILDNDFYAGYMISMIVGTTNLSYITMRSNYFYDTKDFQYVMDFEMNNEINITGSYFEDNGVTMRKIFYLTKDNNVLVSIWIVRYSHFSNNSFITGKNIDLVTGFIESIPHMGLFECYNNVFIILDTNSNFRYKGILLDHFKEGWLINNTFFNIVGNNQDFYHSHGGIMLGAASGFSYVKNNYFLHFEGNIFINCSCIYGGGLAIISISQVFLINNSFFNTSSTYYGGNMMIVAGEKLVIQGLYLNESIGDEGGGVFLQNIWSIEIKDFVINNAISRKNGVIYCKNINYLNIYKLYAYNLTSQMNGGFMYLYNTIATIEYITINSIGSDLDGGAIYIHGGSSLILRHSVINSVFGTVGGSISIENGNNIVISNTSFENSYSLQKGAVMFIDVLKSFSINDIFINNCFTDGNGVLFIKTEDESTVFQLNNITCQNTFSLKGSCFYFLSASTLNIFKLNIINNGPIPIFVLWSFQIALNFSYIEIKNTYINDSLVYISGVMISCNKWNIFNNSANSLIYLQSVTAYFNDFSLRNNKGEYSLYSDTCLIDIRYFSIINDFINDLGFCYMMATQINLNKIEIFAGFSSKNVFFDAQDGTILMENSQIHNNKGQIFNLVRINITINLSYFGNNTYIDDTSGNEINYENLDNSRYSIIIENSNFSTYFGFSMRFYGLLSININNSNFISLTSGKTSSLYILDAYAILLNHSNFFNFNQGALIIYNYNTLQATNVIINYCHFVNNSAYIGSSLYFYGNFIINLLNSVFDSNIAKIQKNSTVINNLQGIASCLFLKELDHKISKITINWTKVVNNYAEFIAPTVFSQLSINSSNNTFFNNSDSYNFSNKFYSYPLSLEYLNSSQNNIIFNIVSGIAFDLNLVIIDNFNQNLIFDNKTIFLIKPQLSTNSTNSQSILILNGLSQTKLGQISFKNLIIKLKPDTNFTLTVYGTFAGLSNNQANELNSITIEKNINFYARKCHLGEIILADNGCYFCSKGTYSLIDPMQIETKYQKCNECPLNCFCYGGIYITPLAGYYRKGNISINAVSCLNSDACLGDPLLMLENDTIQDFNLSLSIGLCRVGNIDTLCYYCDYNYGRYNKNDYCQECASVGVIVYIRLSFFILLLIIYILLNSHFAERSHLEKKSIFANMSTFFKIIVNHSQHITIILMSTAAFPFPSFNSFFNLSDYLSFSNDHVITNDCLTQKIYYDKETTVIFKEVFNTALPVLFSILSFLIWIILNYLLTKFEFFSTRMQKIPSNLKAFFSKILLFIVLSVFIFYSLIVKSCFGLFSCMTIDSNDSETYLKESPNLQCWTNPHITYVFIFGLPGLIMWGVVFPSFLYIILRRNVKVISMADKTGISKLASSVSRSVNNTVKDSKENSRHDYIKQEKIVDVRIGKPHVHKIAVARKSHYNPTIKKDFEENDENFECPVENLEIGENLQKSPKNMKNNTNPQENMRYKPENKYIVNNDDLDEEGNGKELFVKINAMVIPENDKSAKKQEKEKLAKEMSIVKVKEEEEMIEKFMTLTQNHDKRLKTLKSRAEKVTYIKNMIQNVEHSRIFIFFYKDFQPVYFYWECLIFVRKFILTFLSSMAESVAYEIILILMLIIIFNSISLTMKCSPYKLKIANFVELSSLIVCGITIFSALIFRSNCPIGLINFIAVICILFNILFFILVIGTMIWDALKRYQMIQKMKNESQTRTHSSNKVVKNLVSKKYIVSEKPIK